MSWLPAVVTAAPASEPITLAEAKAQCRVEGTDSDTELTSMISAARSLVEDHCGTKLVSQTVALRCSRFCDLIDLPVAPIVSVTSIAYLDTNGVSQTLSTDIYEVVLIGLEPMIRLKLNQSWPAVRCASDAITVTAVAGYAALPATIGHAIKLQVSSWFDDRAIGGLSDGTLALLANHRRF